jgi:hypothetical protein
MTHDLAAALALCLLLAFTGLLAFGIGYERGEREGRRRLADEQSRARHRIYGVTDLTQRRRTP